MFLLSLAIVVLSWINPVHADDACIHRATEGEILGRIANNHGVTLAQAKNLNPWLANRRSFDFIKPGDPITLCATTPAVAIAASPTFPRAYDQSRIETYEGASGTPLGFYATISQLENLEGAIGAWQRRIDEKLITVWRKSDGHQATTDALWEANAVLAGRINGFEEELKRFIQPTPSNSKSPEFPFAELLAALFVVNRIWNFLIALLKKFLSPVWAHIVSWRQHTHTPQESQEHVVNATIFDTRKGESSA